MTDAVMIACIVAVPPTIASVGAIILGIVNHQQGKEIHVLVNSNLTAVKNDLSVANDHIVQLQTLVRQMTNVPVHADGLMEPPPSPTSSHPV